MYSIGEIILINITCGILLAKYIYGIESAWSCTAGIVIVAEWHRVVFHIPSGCFICHLSNETEIPIKHNLLKIAKNNTQQALANYKRKKLPIRKIKLRPAKLSCHTVYKPGFRNDISR